DPHRRQQLHTDAGGGYDEENGVCYLQILLSAQLAGMGQQRMLADMDRWGYSFRLGSSQAWFAQDADDARRWLQAAGLIDGDNAPTWKVREHDCAGDAAASSSANKVYNHEEDTHAL
ncbi:MAG: hypothetical protein R6X06_09950, partial [Gammaproteobacteria bacterium]